MVSKRKIKVDTKLLFEQPITLIKRRDLVTFNNPVRGSAGKRILLQSGRPGFDP